eukprot:3035234-Prymnesium_polylepis.1
MCAFAAECVPIRRAAREAQIDDEHAEAPLPGGATDASSAAPAGRAAQQQHRPHWLQEAFAAAS